MSLEKAKNCQTERIKSLHQFGQIMRSDCILYKTTDRQEDTDAFLKTGDFSFKHTFYWQ